MMDRKLIILFCACMIGFWLAGVSLAATDAFDLSRWTVDGGGGVSTGGGYNLHGTIGQADAGYQMTGGGYTLGGGFWGSGDVAPPPSPSDQQLYLPIVIR